MVRNAVAVLSAAWFSLTPALCVAGVLKHDCECAETAGCCSSCAAEAEDEGCDCVDEGCSHDDCAGDPCQTALSAGTGGHGGGDLDASKGLEPAFASLLPASTLRSAPSGLPGLPAPRKNLPYHLSDVPLLT